MIAGTKKRSMMLLTLILGYCSPKPLSFFQDGHGLKEEEGEDEKDEKEYLDDRLRTLKLMPSLIFNI